MASFDQFQDILLGHEGGVYISDDHGRGPSKWGITLQTAQECEPDWTAETIQALTRDQAAAFYQAHFWDRYRFGLLDSQTVANKVCDLGVNVGPGTAIKFLQTAVGAQPDGVMGPATAAAANAMDSDAVLAGVRAAGANHYQQIVQVHPEWAADLPGWMARLNS
jgi:lysozyme family protein